MFFKGYVETKDKKCIEKFKNRTDFKTYEQVKSLPEFAGILDEETILVDIDDFAVYFDGVSFFDGFETNNHAASGVDFDDLFHSCSYYVVLIIFV